LICYYVSLESYNPKNVFVEEQLIEEIIEKLFMISNDEGVKNVKAAYI